MKTQIAGSAGRLEVVYHQAETMDSPIALLLHGAPQFGGNMNHWIMYQSYYAMLHRGYTVMRMNFRGTGRSTGSFDHGEGELEDAGSALDWLQTQNPGAKGALVMGYSFGAWIGMQLMSRRPEIKEFVCVAPPAMLYDFSMVSTDFCQAKGIIVAGERDAVARPAHVETLVQFLNKEKHMADYSVIPGANHFFDGQVTPLMESIVGFLERSREEPPRLERSHPPGEGEGF